mmetsp:Transcript_87205/g.174481  ORF Transcript_87205/g.174481 Transcript_87205/m.174481 type:complete len:239 (-) Transcript_87205:208-924(-)
MHEALPPPFLCQLELVHGECIQDFLADEEHGHPGLFGHVLKHAVPKNVPATAAVVTRQLHVHGLVVLALLWSAQAFKLGQKRGLCFLFVLRRRRREGSFYFFAFPGSRRADAPESFALALAEVRRGLHQVHRRRLPEPRKRFRGTQDVRHQGSLARPHLHQLKLRGRPHGCPHSHAPHTDCFPEDLRYLRCSGEVAFFANLRIPTSVIPMRWMLKRVLHILSNREGAKGLDQETQFIR